MNSEDKKFYGALNLIGQELRKYGEFSCNRLEKEGMVYILVFGEMLNFIIHFPKDFLSSICDEDGEPNGEDSVIFLRNYIKNQIEILKEKGRVVYEQFCKDVGKDAMWSDLPEIEKRAWCRVAGKEY